MRERIKKLKSIAANIEAAKYGKRGKDTHINSYTVISEYHEWRAESEDLFYHFFDESNPQFQDFRSFPKDGNGYKLIHYFNQQYPIFKILIRKIENGEFVRKKSSTSEINPEKPKSMKTVFISHAVKDKEIVNAFMDHLILGGLGIPIDQIFCVSTDGAKIKSGTDWRNAIKDSLTSARIIVLIITPNYKESEFSLCEMGAAWMTNAQILSLIVDPINYETVGVIQEPNQIEKLLNEQSLDRIKDIMQYELNLTNIKSDRWTTKKKEFISYVKQYLMKNRFSIPLDRIAFNKLLTENEELNRTVENVVYEKSELENLLKDIIKVKDQDEVKKVLKKHRSNSPNDELLRISKAGKEILKTFHPIIRGIIFKSFTGKNVTINWEPYRNEIDEALAKDFITEDIEANWETTLEMQKIYSILVDLSELLKRDLDQDIYKNFAEDFKAPLKLDNLTFWENFFDMTLQI